mmetsp:Transcript_60609/g.136393  ORF Transcript_60609/g.136393 Transcript_60609/m.136393 type:complete len:673 (-) Transcript_60609:80-2098(-)
MADRRVDRDDAGHLLRRASSTTEASELRPRPRQVENRHAAHTQHNSNTRYLQIVEDIEAEVKALRKGHGESSSSSARLPAQHAPSSMPEDAEPRMLVFERPQSWNKAKVEAAFSEYGKVEAVKLGEVPRLIAGRKVMQRAATVTFCRLEDAQAAWHRMNSLEFDGLRLDIKMKQPRSRGKPDSAGNKAMSGSVTEVDRDNSIDLQRATSFRSSSLNSGRSHSPAEAEERLRHNGAHADPPLRSSRSRPPPPPMPASIPPPPLPSDGKHGGYAPSRSSRSHNSSPPPALRKPPPPRAEADSARMLVLERPPSWTKARVEALFSKYGEVENIKIGEAKRIVAGKQVMQRAAAVTFCRFEDAQVARQQLNGKKFDGLTLNLKMKQPSAMRNPATASGSSQKGAKMAMQDRGGTPSTADTRSSQGQSSPPRRHSGETVERREMEHLGLSVCAKAASRAQVRPSTTGGTDVMKGKRGVSINARSVVIRNLPPECCSFAWFVHQFPHIKVTGTMLPDETSAGSCWAIVDCEKASDAHLLKSDITQKCFTDAPVMAKVVDPLDRARSASQLRRNDARLREGPRRPGLHAGRVRQSGRASLVKNQPGLLLRRRAVASRRLLAPAASKAISTREERHVRRTMLTRGAVTSKKRPASESRDDYAERVKRPYTRTVANGSSRM